MARTIDGQRTAQRQPDSIRLVRMESLRAPQKQRHFRGAKGDYGGQSRDEMRSVSKIRSNWRRISRIAVS